MYRIQKVDISAAEGMKWVLLTFGMIVLILAVMGGSARAETCEECTKESPCAFNFPTEDDCNTCLANTWCVNGQWYRDEFRGCTMRYCPRVHKLDNPYAPSDGSGIVFTNQIYREWHATGIEGQLHWHGGTQ